MHLTKLTPTHVSMRAVRTAHHMSMALNRLSEQPIRAMRAPLTSTNWSVKLWRRRRISVGWLSFGLCFKVVQHVSKSSVWRCRMFQWLSSGLCFKIVHVSNSRVWWCRMFQWPGCTCWLRAIVGDVWLAGWGGQPLRDVSPLLSSFAPLRCQERYKVFPFKQERIEKKILNGLLFRHLRPEVARHFYP